MALSMKAVFTAVSVAAAAAAAAAFNFQMLQTSKGQPGGLDFAELAPPAPELQVIESPDGTKTVIAYVTKTAAGEIIIKTLPAVTVTAAPTGGGLPTTDAGATVTATPTSTSGPTNNPIETVSSTATPATVAASDPAAPADPAVPTA